MEDTQYYIWILVKYDGCKNIFLLRYNETKENRSSGMDLNFRWI